MSAENDNRFISSLYLLVRFLRKKSVYPLKKSFLTGADGVGRKRRALVRLKVTKKPVPPVNTKAPSAAKSRQQEQTTMEQPNTDLGNVGFPGRYDRNFDVPQGLLDVRYLIVCHFRPEAVAGNVLGAMDRGSGQVDRSRGNPDATAQVTLGRDSRPGQARPALARHYSSVGTGHLR